jgi:hyperosmotically inducible protein
MAGPAPERYSFLWEKGEKMKYLKRIIGSLGFAAALVCAGCAGDSGHRSTGQFIDDTSIHTKVKAALINDPVVSGTQIDVQVDRGVVVLTGAVNGDVAKRKAEAIARGVDGVKGVENNIVVRK